MGNVAFRCQEYAEGNPAAASIVAGFDGNRFTYEPAARALLARGYDVYTYDYDNDVLLAGDPMLLPGLIGEIRADFETRAQDAEVHRHLGKSLGCGIAWNLQKDSSVEVKPGLYAAGGIDVARLLMHNIVFQGLIRKFHKVNIKDAYNRNGYGEDDLRAIWADIQTPPQTGFVLALGGLDPVIPPWQIRPRVRQWQHEGITMHVTTIRHLGHTGMKKWLIGHIPHMLELSRSKLERDEVLD